MNINTYQKLAARTINKELADHEIRRHALFGMCSELGEVHSLYQREYQGDTFDDEEVVKELGDLMWFVAELATSLGASLDDICSKNIEKLLKRYPDGFDEYRSANRHSFGED